jgi:hypothetical protein
MDDDKEVARSDAATETAKVPLDEKLDYLLPFKSKAIRSQNGQVVSGYRWLPWLRAAAVGKQKSA